MTTNKEVKRRVILFTLLVTLSSVMGLDLSFSKEAYDAVLTNQEKLGMIFKDAETIEFLNPEHDEELFVASDEEVKEEDLPEGIHMAPKEPKTVKAAIAGVENRGQEPERLIYMSIVFTKISDQTKETFFGNLLICFQNDNNVPCQSCLKTLMFSPPKTPEDESYAKVVAEKLNPLSKTQIDSISNKKLFKWNLSSFKVLLSGAKKITNSPDMEHSTFALKPIIVDESLLKQYFDLAHPSGSVIEVGSLDYQVLLQYSD